MVNFFILIILHLLGDFYLQTAKVSKCKNAKVDSYCYDCAECKKDAKLNYKYILIHTILYLIPFIMVFFMTDGLSGLKIVLILLISHGIIDGVACFFNKKTKQTLVFLLDQFLHICIIFVICKMFVFASFFSQYVNVIKVVFVTLVLMSPCSIFINKLFEDLYPETVNNKIFDVGSVIGILERFLIIIFSYLGNFAAIAIIITVKTWARTNDLKEDDFRNKYLLGTLASFVLALVIFIVSV